MVTVPTQVLKTLNPGVLKTGQIKAAHIKSLNIAFTSLFVGKNIIICKKCL